MLITRIYSTFRPFNRSEFRDDILAISRLFPNVPDVVKQFVGNATEEKTGDACFCSSGVRFYDVKFKKDKLCLHAKVDDEMIWIIPDSKDFVIKYSFYEY